MKESREIERIADIMKTDFSNKKKYFDVSSDSDYV